MGLCERCPESQILALTKKSWIKISKAVESRKTAEMLLTICTAMCIGVP